MLVSEVWLLQQVMIMIWQVSYNNEQCAKISCVA